MMRYVLYRIIIKDFEILKDINNIKIDFLPTPLSNEDKIIVFVSESLKIIGTYKKEEDFLAAERIFEKDINLKDFYDKLSIVSKIGPRTYKIFAKKIKEISKKDYEMIANKE